MTNDSALQIWFEFEPRNRLFLLLEPLFLARKVASGRRSFASESEVMFGFDFHNFGQDWEICIKKNSFNQSHLSFLSLIH